LFRFDISTTCLFCNDNGEVAEDRSDLPTLEPEAARSTIASVVGGFVALHHIRYPMGQESAPSVRRMDGSWAATTAVEIP
jgi:hypothetical protein